ncbi:hypothetical protein Patl1_16006 [Pistacia atlantica]|uniref:Uncharacterized protein n=1 Tax=Pistacia atlantica TaxID=434234 RepID=A0ACC1B6H6_9ROSI|nr:hypothetical protein Patl1_16006 [Pistacia atlantica]
MGSFSADECFPYVGWIVDRLSGYNAKLERVFKEFDAFFHQIIRDHLKPDVKKQEPEDIIDVMLKIEREQTESCRGARLTNDHIKAVLSVEIRIAPGDQFVINGWLVRFSRGVVSPMVATREANIQEETGKSRCQPCSISYLGLVQRPTAIAGEQVMTPKGGPEKLKKLAKILKDTKKRNNPKCSIGLATGIVLQLIWQLMWEEAEPESKDKLESGRKLGWSSGWKGCER